MEKDTTAERTGGAAQETTKDTGKKKDEPAVQVFKPGQCRAGLKIPEILVNDQGFRGYRVL